VEEFKDHVYNTCIGFLGNREEAEDAAQEVFIEVYRSVSDFREEARLSTWIYRIAVSKCLLALRRKHRKKRFAIFFSGHAEEEVLDGISDPDEMNNPGAALEMKEQARALYTALGKLPESQRVAFTLHKIEGLSYQNIAEVMNASLPAVESLIHRAKMNMRKQLYNYYCRQTG